MGSPQATYTATDALRDYEGGFTPRSGAAAGDRFKRRRDATHALSV